MKVFLFVTLAAAATVSALAGLFIAWGTEDTASVTASSIYQPEETEYREHFFDKQMSISHTITDIPVINQLPELPTGCEVTSLTMVLDFWGFDASKMDIAQNYLEKGSVEADEDEEKLYGPDFRYVFAGDPEDEKSFGCLAPCIVSAAEKYISERSSDLEVTDITGTSFYKLLEYIENDIPVIIWYTMGLVDPQYLTSWTTSDGQTVVWPTNEHCVVLSAYDYSKNTVRLHDPTDGVVTINMEKVKERYDQIGKNAVVITAKRSE